MAHIIIQYGDQRRLIAKPPTYELLIQLARGYFAIPASTGLAPRYFPGVGTEESLDLMPENYDEVQDCTFISFSPPANLPTGPELPVMPPPAKSPVNVAEKPKAPPVPKIKKIFIVYNGSCKFEVNPKKGCTIATLKKLAARQTGYDDRFFGLSYEGRPLCTSKMIQDYNVQNDSTIEMDTSFGVAKQAIYLLKPAANRTIEFSLTVSCKPPFSVRSSDLQPTSAAATSHTWSVSVHQESDDDAHIMSIPRQYAFRYLTWTGETPTDVASLPLYPQPVPGEALGAYNPWIPLLTPESAYVLRIGDFIPFLENTLEKLRLTPQMRSDFLFSYNAQLQRINDFWSCVAFHFISQGAFPDVSQIRINSFGRAPRHPVPAVVSRILLLFGGLEVTSRNWKQKLLTLEQAKAIDWAAEIGLDVQKMWDDANLRVIEVGAMEVPLFKNLSRMDD